MIVDDFDLIGCIAKSNTRTEEGAIEILRCLNTHDIVVYWSDKWGRLIARSKSGRRGSWKSIMEEIMKILKIDGKEDWERIKRKYDL